MQPGTFDVCVTTYEALRYVPEIRKKYKWYYIIFDEAHKLKNSESITFQLAASLQAQRRLLLTGTPL
jgi:SWI/SNF-related matrix-associated actin-dependent regulator of chromatin subfamily A member 5